MDNGLIFPYRLYRANAESSFAKDMKPAIPSGRAGGSSDPDWY